MDHATAEALCTHPAVGMITLTGSVNAGRKVLDYCKANIAKPSLELGGKTPAIIRPTPTSNARPPRSSRRDDALRPALHGDRTRVRARQRARPLRRAAEGRWRPCASATVRKTHADGARQRIGARAHPRDGRTRDRCRRDARNRRCDSGRPGFFYPATLLTGVRRDMEIVQEKPSARSCPCCATTIDEAIGFANDHQFGLSSVLYTEHYAPR